jgi:hypothetical protein
MPRPPEDLSHRIDQLIGDASCAVPELPTSLILQAKVVLSKVGSDRSAAIDLLAADALITYAMEAAAEQDSIDSVARIAMHEIASVIE